jgi:hypothetical protein
VVQLQRVPDRHPEAVHLYPATSGLCDDRPLFRASGEFHGQMQAGGNSTNWKPRQMSFQSNCQQLAPLTVDQTRPPKVTIEVAALDEL